MTNEMIHPDRRYLELLSRDYPTIEAVASEMITLSALRSLPKGTEYFFSDLHGEYESFLRLLRSASGMIKSKIDLIFEKSLSAHDRNTLATLIYYPESEIKTMSQAGNLDDEWRRITIYRLILVCEAVSAKYTREAVRAKMPGTFFDTILDELLNVTDDINRDYYFDEINAFDDWVTGRLLTVIYMGHFDACVQELLFPFSTFKLQKNRNIKHTLVK